MNRRRRARERETQATAGRQSARTHVMLLPGRWLGRRVPGLGQPVLPVVAEVRVGRLVAVVTLAAGQDLRGGRQLALDCPEAFLGVPAHQVLDGGAHPRAVLGDGPGRLDRRARPVPVPLQRLERYDSVVLELQDGQHLP